MEKQYTIPQLLTIAANQVRYSPALGAAINNVLTAKTQVDYDAAMEDATSISAGYADFGRNHQSAFGLPIFMPVELELDDQSILLDSSVASFQRTKNVVITKVQGNDQAVTEFINNGTPRINISGILCKRGYGYPIDLVEELNQLLTAKKPLKIIHEKMNALGVYEVVILDYDFPTTQFMNCQPYSINCIKDEPINLRIY